MGGQPEGFQPVPRDFEFLRPGIFSSPCRGTSSSCGQAIFPLGPRVSLRGSSSCRGTSSSCGQLFFCCCNFGTPPVPSAHGTLDPNGVPLRSALQYSTNAQLILRVSSSTNG